ncbi:ParB/RepB/Spo0J family partition protein [Halostella sp. JP-L12]|uniref:ParB/RepB/Spo0J family partition protein n=1 Tax=Halostella TaxID=1843185 RepID=UPI000EF81246|nr:MULTISPECIES: ParB/RepB/Spo0J family partition protein [Halostella]NHN48397.1 ParB/RepB/Spo0J family partition protein [Halostella sp. JP-L12]
MVEYTEIDPNELEIDELNERKEDVGPHKGIESLEESVRQQGVIEAPIVRNSGDGNYKVIVGQRRTLAAQAAGLDEIPVRIVDWDDAEAIEASITENVDAFRKSVSRTDRSEALLKLMKINDWTQEEAAEQLGISSAQVGEWLERTRDAWEGTDVHVSSNGETDSETRAKVDQVDDKKLSAIRRATGGGEEGEKLVKKVSEDDISQREVLEAKKRADRGEDFEKAIEEVHSQQSAEGDMRVSTQVTFTGDYAEGLQSAAKTRGTSEDQIVREAIEDYLKREGYL